MVKPTQSHSDLGLIHSGQTYSPLSYPQRGLAISREHPFVPFAHPNANQQVLF